MSDKHCPKCNTVKSVNEFYLQKRKSGLRTPASFCKRCVMKHYSGPRNKKQQQIRWEKNSKILPPSLPGEVWVDVKGYEDMYEVSNMARVRSRKFHRVTILKAPVNKHIGYRYLHLCKNGETEQFYLHRLVATAFIPNPHNWPEVNHKDGDRANCLPDNLEWCTHRQNIHHAIHTLGRHAAINSTAIGIKNLAADTKYCSDCATTKSKTEFHRNNRSLIGLCAYCKSCQRKRMQNYNARMKALKKPKIKTV